jgi:hypothetical protein
MISRERLLLCHAMRQSAGSNNLRQKRQRSRRGDEITLRVVLKDWAHV